MTLTPESKERKPNPRITPHEAMRRRRGFTVTALARAVGVTHAYVSQVEHGVAKPSARYRAAASRVLDVPEELLFEAES